VGEQRFSLASGFQHAQLKNRISMMLNPSSRGWMRLSYLALIPLMAVLVYACNPSKNNKAKQAADEAEAVAPDTKASNGTYKVTVTDKPQADETSIPFSEVEVKPTFQGDDPNAFAVWVNSHLVYPEAAVEAGTQGRMVLSFVVDTDGSVTDVQILRGLSPELDAEALRVMNSCTEKWTPGMQDGKPVKVTYTMPIVFQLK
jgi:TonB family protein